MTKQEFTEEQIENGLRTYFTPPNKGLSQFHLMVIAAEAKEFQALAPAMLLQLWNEKQRAERKREKAGG